MSIIKVLKQLLFLTKLWPTMNMPLKFITIFNAIYINELPPIPFGQKFKTYSTIWSQIINQYELKFEKYIFTNLNSL
jgi:hypothetical protein